MATKPSVTPPLGHEALDARLVMRGIGKRFGATVALDGVDFHVGGGEVLALVGENGAGKSTLMKILAGVLRPDTGTMSLHGEPYRPRNPADARQQGVAMIYQELSLAPHLNVTQNIALGLEPTRLGFLKSRDAQTLALDALARLDQHDIPLHKPVASLPVAAQQIVEIARALVVIDQLTHQPTPVDGGLESASSRGGGGVIVLDEPTSSLGRERIEKLFAVIQRLRDAGHAVVYISHFIEEVQRIADRVAVLRDGQSVGGGAVRELSAGRIIELMVGREVVDLYPRSERTAGEVALELSGLAGLEKPQDASLSLRRGEVLGIAGLVGAGRTEMLRSVFGLDPVKRGEIRVVLARGQVFSGAAAPAKRLRQGVGLLSEDRKGEGLALPLSVADNLTLSRLGPTGPLGLVLPRRQRRLAAAWQQQLAVRCRHVGQPVRDLSGGNQQKVAIGRLLHHDVDLLLLDEPTRGVDVGSKAQIYQWIDKLARQGKAILLVSSYLPELMGVCDRVAVMCRGKLGPAHHVADVDEHRLMMEATGAASP